MTISVVQNEVGKKLTMAETYPSRVHVRVGLRLQLFMEVQRIRASFSGLPSNPLPQKPLITFLAP